jgi:hypothetical protein
VRLSTADRRRKPGELWIADPRCYGEVPELESASGADHDAWLPFPFLIRVDSSTPAAHDGDIALVDCFASLSEWSVALLILRVDRRGLIGVESHQLLGVEIEVAALLRQWKGGPSSGPRGTEWRVTGKPAKTKYIQLTHSWQSHCEQGQHFLSDTEEV